MEEQAPVPLGAQIRDGLRLLAILLVVLPLLAYGLYRYFDARPAVGTATPAAPALAANERRVTAADYPGRWPLTVNEGVLACHGTAAMAVTLRTGQTTYALNGAAAGNGEWAPVESLPTRAVDGQMVGSLGDLITDGLALCE
jgi:Protein of unknown function (DUF2511)